MTAEDVRRCTYDITIFGRHRWTRFPIYIVGIGSCVSISSIPSLLRLHVRIYIYMLPKFLIYCHRQYFSVYTFVCPLLWLTTAINNFLPCPLSNRHCFVESLVHGTLIDITRANILVLCYVTGAIEINFKRKCRIVAESGGIRDARNVRGEANSCGIIAQQLNSIASSKGT